MAVEKNPFRDLLGNDASFQAHLALLNTPLEDDPEANKMRRFLNWRLQQENRVNIREDMGYHFGNPKERVYYIEDKPVDFLLVLHEQTILEIQKNDKLRFNISSLHHAVSVTIPQLLDHTPPLSHEEMYATWATVNYREGDESSVFNISRPDDRYGLSLELQNVRNVHSVLYSVENKERGLAFALGVENNDKRNPEPILNLALPAQHSWPPELLSWIFDQQHKPEDAKIPRPLYWQNLSSEITQLQQTRRR